MPKTATVFAEVDHDLNLRLRLRLLKEKTAFRIWLMDRMQEYLETPKKTKKAKKTRRESK